MTDNTITLAEGQRELQMSDDELWTRCLAIHSDLTPEQIRQHIDDDECPHPREHNIIAQALNDAFVELGQDHPVGYRHQAAPSPGTRDFQ